MTDPAKKRRFQTRAVHIHRPPPPEQLSSSVPIFQSSTFRFETNEEFARAIRFDGPGYVYSRGYGNPTIDAFQSAMADLEETESAMGFASGIAAISSLFLTVAGSGSRIVAGTALYGGTVSILRNILPRFGVEATFVDPTDLDQVRDALPGADLFYCETIVNPTTTVPDLAALASLCREAGVLSAVDNTFASPYLCNPVTLGFDVRDPFGDEVHRRARGSDRGRRLHERGPLPEAARHGDRPRRNHAASRGMALPAGTDDPQPADGAPLRLGADGSHRPSQPTPPWSASTTRDWSRTRSTSSRSASYGISAAPLRSRWSAGSKRAAALRRRSSSDGSPEASGA